MMIRALLIVMASPAVIYAADDPFVGLRTIADYERAIAHEEARMEALAARIERLEAARDVPRAIVNATARLTTRVRTKDGASALNVGSGTVLGCAHKPLSSGAHAGMYPCAIATVWHVWRGALPNAAPTAEFFKDGARMFALPMHLVSTDPKADIALVVVYAPEPLSSMRLAPRAASVVRAGEPVVQAGCPKGVDPLVYSDARACVTSVNRYAGPKNFETSAQPTQGASGGGCFTLRGEFIGICNAADPRENRGLFSDYRTLYDLVDVKGGFTITNGSIIPAVE
jgi:S1-C subfamily serine protease